MKTLLLFLCLCATVPASAQDITWSQWTAEAEHDIRLLPRYGDVVKSPALRKLDREFVDKILSQGRTPRVGSQIFIRKGFELLGTDTKTAMYRFNQAYLLDSTNVDVYRAYASVYTQLGQLALAREQYEAGLARDSTNTVLLTEYGIHWFREYYTAEFAHEESSEEVYEKGVFYLLRSYELDPANPVTTFHLAVHYLKRGACDQAWKYHDESVATGAGVVAPGFTEKLKEECPR